MIYCGSKEISESTKGLGEIFSDEDELAEENLIEEDLILNVEVKDKFLVEHSNINDAANFAVCSMGTLS